MNTPRLPEWNVEVHGQTLAIYRDGFRTYVPTEAAYFADELLDFVRDVARGEDPDARQVRARDLLSRLDEGAK